MILRFFLILFFLASRLLAATPETPLSASRLMAAAFDQQSPDVIVDADMFLITWQSADTRAARVLSNGELLDPVGIPLNHDHRLVTQTAGAGTFLLVWRSATELYATRLARDGEQLPATPLLTLGRDGVIGGAVAGWNGTNFLVIANNTAIFITFDGSVTRKVSPVTPDGILPFRLFSRGTDFLYVTRGLIQFCHPCPHRFYATLIKSSGETSDPIELAQTEVGRYLSNLSFDGEKFLVIDHHGVEMSRVRIVTPEGKLLKEPFPLWSQGGVKELVWTGESHFATFGRSEDVGKGPTYAMRIRSDGTILDPEPFQISYSRTSSDTALGFNGRAFLFVWSDYRNGYWNEPEERPWENQNRTDLFGRILNGSGRPLWNDEILISHSAPLQQNADLAWNGTEYIGVWQERVEPDHRSAVVFGRITPDGRLMDGEGIRAAPTANYQLFPQITAGTSSSLLVWIEQERGTGKRSLLGIRISQAGVILDPVPIRIADEATHRFSYYTRPRVAWNGEIFLVVWDKRLNWPTGTYNPDDDIYGARLTAEGVLLDPEGFRISPRDHAQVSPSILWNGTHFVVAWEERVVRSCGPRFCSFSHDIAAARLDRSGNILDVAPSKLTSTTQREEAAPDIACVANDCVAAFHDLGWPSNSGYLLPFRITETGIETLSQSEALRIPESRPHTIELSIVASGKEFVAVWRGGGYEGSFDFEGDIKSARTNRSGELLESPQPISASVNDERVPAVIAGPGSAIGIAYTRTTSDTTYGSTDRVFMRQILPPRRRAATR